MPRRSPPFKDDLMDQGLYYLASPLKGSPEEEAYRFEVSLKLTMAFLTQGIYVFSPLIYTKKIAETLNSSSIEERREIIMTYLLRFLKTSKGLILVTLEGWQKSWGVNQEIKFCQENQMPVYVMCPDQASKDLSKIFDAPLSQQQVTFLLEAFQ